MPELREARKNLITVLNTVTKEKKFKEKFGFTFKLEEVNEDWWCNIFFRANREERERESLSAKLWEAKVLTGSFRNNYEIWEIYPNRRGRKSLYNLSLLGGDLYFTKKQYAEDFKNALVRMLRKRDAGFEKYLPDKDSFEVIQLKTD
jgi:hypothetical protein